MSTINNDGLFTVRFADGIRGFLLDNFGGFAGLGDETNHISLPGKLPSQIHSFPDQQVLVEIKISYLPQQDVTNVYDVTLVCSDSGMVNTNRYTMKYYAPENITFTNQTGWNQVCSSIADASFIYQLIFSFGTKMNDFQIASYRQMSFSSTTTSTSTAAGVISTTSNTSVAMNGGEGGR